jgi:hypothetical protein
MVNTSEELAINCLSALSDAKNDTTLSISSNRRAPEVNEAVYGLCIALKDNFYSEKLHNIAPIGM